MKKWFITWRRPEYREWASPTNGGYVLLIIRKEQKRFLCIKALLIMGNIGLPNFKVDKEKYFISELDAWRQIEKWRV